MLVFSCVLRESYPYVLIVDLGLARNAELHMFSS